MVSTRRSRSTAGDGNSAEQEAPLEGLPHQPEVSSWRTRKSTAAAAVQAALEPVVEEPAAAAVLEAPVAQEDDEIILTQDLQQHPEPQAETTQHAKEQPKQQQQHAPQPQQQQQHAGVHRPSRQLQQPRQQTVVQQPLQGAATVADSDGDSDDWDFDSPDMLQNLAATIRSALGATAGTKQQQQQPHRPPATGAADSGDAIADAVDLDSLRWRPATGLQLPPRAGQLIQSAATALPAKQQQELAAAGPIVHNSAAAAAAEDLDAETAADASTQAAAAGVSKPKGLAKHTRVPTLDPAAAAKEARKLKPDTAGKKWYDLPAVKITDEVKRDLRLLRLRGAYDPKRFYRSFDETKFPKHFAVSGCSDINACTGLL